MSRRAAAAVFAAAHALSACGGGSSLDATSSGDAGSSPVAACPGLVLSGEPIGGTFSVLGLASATDDGALVSVVLRDLSPQSPPSALGSTTLSPWGSWPPSDAPVFTACPQCALTGEVLAGPALPAAQPGFSLLAQQVNDPDDWESAETVLFPAVDAGTNYDSSPTEVSWTPPLGDTVALERGASGHLTAFSHRVTGHVSLAYIDAATLALQPIDDVVCPGVFSRRSIARVQGGFLVAAVSTQSFGDCASAGDIEVPRVQVVRIDEATKQHTITASFATTSTTSYVALAKRTEGAWLIWQSADGYGENPGSIHVLRLSESGAVLGPVVRLTGDEDGLFAWSSTAMGPRLVVALGHGDIADIQFRVLDDDGVVRVNHFDMSPWPHLMAAPRALLASADGTRFLLAGGEHVARFECAR